MARDLDNKIFIPDRVYKLPVVNLPVSSLLKNFFRQHQIIIIGNLQQIAGHVLDQIVNSSEKPFTELRHYILAFQESESKVVLISDEENANRNQSNSDSIKEQNSSLKKILTKTIFIPFPARDWKIADLPISGQLINKIQRSMCGKLYDLNGVKYVNFFRLKSFDEKDIFELYTFFNQLHSPEVFGALEAQVIALAQNEKQDEDLPLRETSLVSKNISTYPPAPILDTSKTANQVSFDLSEKIETPASLRNLPFDDLAPSDKLSGLLNKMKISLLGELYGIYYHELKQRCNFDQEALAELHSLMTFAKKFARYTIFSGGFENIKKAALKRRENEIQASFDNRNEHAQSCHEEQIVAETEKSQIKNETDKLINTNGFPTHNESSQRISEILDRRKNFQEKKLNLWETLDFINTYLSKLSATERDILLDRFGGSFDERILTFEAIAGNHQISREKVYQIYQKTLNVLMVNLRPSSKEVLEKLYADCVSNICPLTPKFLIHLTNKDYELFQYPPGFYIRIFGVLLKKLPVLPEIKNTNIVVKENAKKIEKKIKSILQDNDLPLSLPNIFDRLVNENSDKESLETDFYEAIQSVAFNLIETKKPDELFLELRESK